MRALVTAPFTDDGLSTLRASGLDVDYRCWLETGKLHLGDSLLKVINKGGYEVVVVEGDEVKEDVIEGSNLKLIGCVRGNPRNIAVAEATANGIPVIIAPGRNARAVAELTVCLMLCQARNITAADRLLQREFLVDDFGDFAGMYKSTMGFELKERTIGLIGLGQVGFSVAKILQSFEVSLLVTDPYIDDSRIAEVSAEKVALDDLLRRSDVVSVHCLPTEETNRMLGKREFELMKKTAVFINTARASITDEYALLEALKSGAIAGAGLDVFSMEPVDCDNVFLELDNVTVTPHIGGNTVDTVERQSEMLANDIRTYLEGGKPHHIVNPEVLK